MCEMLLIEQYALTHSAGEAISLEGRVFRPKALQGRLVQSRVTTISITSKYRISSGPASPFVFRSAAG
jgi:hypothetical protein